ncbi:prostaglandin E2 receptor EP4 subtype-like [Paramormyrops kingsleyae]|uniref:prostaglandin E2 receptor EP4 subtype-like n=1 Tax=Paramormyrops kingsleyae TaxID=1676925 RepID=UPI000CD6720B|nr:prostaglandin E2 receptor EP4 subtype-like isoform X1 [Paramormyrops kingsleyae]
MNIMNTTIFNDTHGKIDAMAVPVLMFGVGVMGNVITIAVLCRSKQERRESAFYTLVCGLAVTDLLGTCLASPVTIANYFEHRLDANHALCEFHSFILLFFGVAGLSIMCTMSAERYLSINHPYTYQRWYINHHSARRGLFVIYLLNIIFCSLPMLGFSKIIPQEPDTWCFIDWRAQNHLHAFYSYLYAAVNSLFILLTVACNVAVCGTLVVMQRRKTRQVSARGGSDQKTLQSLSVEIEMMLLLIVTSVVVLACSTPLVVCVFVNQIQLAAWNKNVDLLAIRIASVNPILDPWVYILLRRTVFHKVLGAWKRLFGVCRRAIRPQGPPQVPPCVMD